MLGLLAWKLVGEPVVLRPRELAPWARMNLLIASVMGGRGPSTAEKLLLIGEDSVFGVCDPEAYGLRRTEHPRPGDIPCWAGDNSVLSTLSRYVNGCRFAHTGIIIADDTVGHITLGGWVEEPVPDGVVVFDAGITEPERSRIARSYANAERPKGYGYHFAILITLMNLGCLSRKSNLFHLLDTMSINVLLWMAGLRWLPALWVVVAAIRVTVNYGIQRRSGSKSVA